MNLHFNSIFIHHQVWWNGQIFLTFQIAVVSRLKKTVFRFQKNWCCKIDVVNMTLYWGLINKDKEGKKSSLVKHWLSSKINAVLSDVVSRFNCNNNNNNNNDNNNNVLFSKYYLLASTVGCISFHEESNSFLQHPLSHVL